MRSTLTALILTCGLWGNDWQASLRLGTELAQQGRYAEALPNLQEGLRGCPPADPAVPKILNLMGRANQAMGRYPEAERDYKRGITFYTGAEPYDPGLIVLWSNLLSLYVEYNHAGPARGVVVRLLAADNRHIEAKPDDLRLLYTNLAGWYGLIREYAEAESMLLRALDVSGGSDPNEDAAILNNLGSVAFAAGRHSAAVVYYERALATLERANGAAYASIASILANLGIAYDRAGREGSADAALGKAMSLAESNLPEFHPVRALVLMDYADVLRRRGRKRQAKGMETRGQAILERLRSDSGARETLDVNEFKPPRR